MRSWILKKCYDQVSVWLLLPAVFLSSCTGTSLSVQTDFLTDESLASYYVQTPDPLLNCGSVGQRMLISWRFPKVYLESSDMYIIVHIRYKNREEEDIRLNNLRTSGTYVFSILNDEFFETEGILTYKAQLFADEIILLEWRHQLWVELITLDTPSTL
jgi:hypothetical protein